MLSWLFLEKIEGSGGVVLDGVDFMDSDAQNEPSGGDACEVSDHFEVHRYLLVGDDHLLYINYSIRQHTSDDQQTKAALQHQCGGSQ